MKAWREVMVPHADIRKGQFDEAVFAADLSDVVAGRGPQEYRDARTFFAKTCPTAGLQKVLLTVLGRLTGTHPGEGVIQIQTPFGGGKTHSLIALYHAVCHPEATGRLMGEVSPELERTLEALRQMSPAPRVAVFVGTAFDALGPTAPWGDIARQLGKYEVVQAHDTAWTAPGRDRLHELLGDEPTLILMDELTECLVRLDERRESQMLAFLHELTESMKVQGRATLVATLPSSAPYGEAGERALNHLQRIFGRVEAIYTPVEGQEVYEVIRRRLFETAPNRAEMAPIAEAYWQMYQRLGEDVPPEVREPAYRERMERAYPFHPELIDILYEQWSTFSTFQRTRGVLRLLAEVVADLSASKHGGALIQPSHLNLANARIRSELLKHIGNQYEGVIVADIAGKDARAAHIDKSAGGEIARLHLAQGMATAIFFASFSGGERQGVTLTNLRVAVLDPDIQPALVGDTLQRLQTDLWYLHTENGIYRFLTEPNLNRILAEREASLSREETTHAIEQSLRQHAGSDLQVTIFPRQSQDMPDSPNLRLAVLSPDRTRHASDTEPLVRDLLERYGSAFRTYRNCILALVADDHEETQLRAYVRRWVALKKIQADRRLMESLSAENRNAVQSRLHDTEQGLLYRLLCTYRHLARLGDSGIQWLDLGLPTVNQRGSLSARVRRSLEEEEMLVRNLSPRYILDRVLRADEPEKPVADIVEVFLRYTSYPMLQNPNVVRETVQRGVQEGLFAVRIGEQTIARRFVSLDDLQDAVLVRAVPEEEPKPAEQSVPPRLGAESPPTETTLSLAARMQTGAVPPTAPHARPRRYHLRLRVPIEQYADILRGVIMPLRHQTDDLQVEMVIHANAGESGFDEAQLNRTVRETLKQLGIAYEEGLE